MHHPNCIENAVIVHELNKVNIIKVEVEQEEQCLVCGVLQRRQHLNLVTMIGKILSVCGGGRGGITKKDYRKKNEFRSKKSFHRSTCP